VPDGPEGKVAPATEGLVFKAHWMDQEQTVGPKCDTNRGLWVCTTHGNSFTTPMERDSHYRQVSGAHVMAWWCLECDRPEVP
jgi:hypothetical protein